VAALDKNVVKGRCKQSDAGYANFYTAVVVPSA
jgi:hypothetical protein